MRISELLSLQAIDLNTKAASKAEVIDYGKDSMLLEFLQTATKNDAVVKLLKEEFRDVEVVRGGSVGIEAISMAER